MARNIYKELVRDMNEYVPRLLDVWKKAPQLRTVPVNRSIRIGLEIMPYERAEELVRRQNKILAAPCICRREHKIAGEGCDKPEDTCLVFGLAAAYYERNGIGRIIDVDEALGILKTADKAGLVLQPSNAKKIVNICCCCGCCCQILKNLKRYSRPAEMASSPFTAAYNPAECSGCGICIGRCPMTAVGLAEGVISLKEERCIGCGLCVSTCPSGALNLGRKPVNLQPEVPKNVTEAHIALGKSRGKQGAVNLAVMQVKSKLDRLLASKEGGKSLDNFLFFKQLLPECLFAGKDLPYE